MQLMLMTFELPLAVGEAWEMRDCPSRRCRLVFPPSQMKRVSVGEGHWADRDDAAIRQCLPRLDDGDIRGELHLRAERNLLKPEHDATEASLGTLELASVYRTEQIRSRLVARSGHAHLGCFVNPRF